MTTDKLLEFRARKLRWYALRNPDICITNANKSINKHLF